MSLVVSSLGYYLPPRSVSNQELLEIIKKKAGPGADLESLHRKLELNKAECRHFKESEETGLDMALNAAERCLEKAGLAPQELDLILYVGMLRDYVEPAMSIMLQDRLNAERAHAFDISNACNGFLNGIEVASMYAQEKGFQNILIVGAEDGSERIPWEMFSADDCYTGFSALTISDGAAAMLLQKKADGKNFDLFRFRTFGKYNDLCKIKIGKESSDLKLNVKSKKLAIVALEIMSEFIPEFLHEATDFLGGIDVWFLHQVTGDPKRFCGKLDEELYNKGYHTFSQVGNTGSVSIPLAMALAEQEGKLKRGDRVAAIVGASGFSYGGTAFVY